jgi:hypothetical protein
MNVTKRKHPKSYLHTSADSAAEKAVIKEIEARMREKLEEAESKINETVRRYHEESRESSGKGVGST